MIVYAETWRHEQSPINSNMHNAFQKIAEVSGAALYQFDFAMQSNPFATPVKHRLQVATKDGKAQPHIEADDGLNWTGDESTEQDFDKNFATFIARLKGA